MSIEQLLKEKRDEILRIAAQHGASNIRIFGSVARGEADAQSDVDFLVELERGRSLLDHAALMIALESLLGRRVDADERTQVWIVHHIQIIGEAREPCPRISG